MTERELCWGYGISIEDVDRALGRRPAPRTAQPTPGLTPPRDLSETAWPVASAGQFEAPRRRAAVR